MPVASSPKIIPRRALFESLRLRVLAGVLSSAMVVTWKAGAVEADGIESTPLKAPPPLDRPMGFTRLSSEFTAISAPNAYADPSMWAARNHAFKFGAIGTGIAIGDYDNDGRPDVLVVRKTESLRLFRNLGDWRFADVTEAAGLAAADGLWREGLSWVQGWVNEQAALAADRPERWKQGVSFADVNNDGWLDLYVCRFNAPNWLFINQGDGSFVEEAAERGVAVVDASGQAAFADYDGDGWLDFFLQTNLLDPMIAPAGQPDRLFRNRGDGTFSDVTAHAGLSGGPTQGHAAMWWDYDEDGRLDLYLANDFAEPDRLYRNLGDGRFRDVLDMVVPHTPHSAMGADLGDVDNDGRIDFFVADMEATSHRKDHRGMAQVRALLNDAPESPGVAPQLMRNALYLNTGTGRMLEAACLAGISATDWTWSPRFEDLDNDGRLDLHVTNGMVRELHNADTVRRLSAAESPAAAGRLEKGLPRLDEPNLVFRNLGNLRFESMGPDWGLDFKGVSFGSAFGDLDGDGDLDLVYSNYEDDVTVMRNDAPAGHRLLVELRGRRSNRFGIGAKVSIKTATGEQVRVLTLARGYLSSSDPVLHFGLGTAERVERLTVTWPGGARQTFTDLAGDHRYRIHESVTAGEAAETVLRSEAWREVGQDMGLGIAVAQRLDPASEAQPLLPRRFDRRAPALVEGDLDGDGRIDVLLGGTTADAPQVLRGQKDGHFGRPQVLPLNEANGPVVLFDAEGDGDLDVLFTRATGDPRLSGSDLQPELWLNDGRGSFSAAPAGVLPSVSLAAGAVVAADFDGDGRTDLFLGARHQPGAFPTTPRSAWWRNEGGRFVEATEAFAPGLERAGMVTAAEAVDLDGDGWRDLVLTTDWGTVQYWHNDQGRGLRDRTASSGLAAAGTGWWSALAVADLNGDGRLDLVAGNAGLNTPYAASPASPAVLLWGDFADSGVPVLVEAHSEAGRLLPRRSRLELANEIRELRRRFRSDNAFADASLEEILGAERVAAARRWETSELRSGVFWQETAGRFRFEPLVRRAQIAPIMAATVMDWDGDGRPDVILGQNDFSPIPAVGNFDGGLGLVLRGDGQGGLEPIDPVVSGLVVTGAAQAIMNLPATEARPDLLVVSRAGERVLVFTPPSSP